MTEPPPTRTEASPSDQGSLDEDFSIRSNAKFWGQEAKEISSAMGSLVQARVPRGSENRFVLATVRVS